MSYQKLDHKTLNDVHEARMNLSAVAYANGRTEGMLTFLISAVITGVIVSLIFVGFQAKAETYHNASGDVITKLEAMKSLIQKPDAKIVKCQEVIMSEKGTIKNKPKEK